MDRLMDYSDSTTGTLELGLGFVNIINLTITRPGADKVKPKVWFKYSFTPGLAPVLLKSQRSRKVSMWSI